MPIIKSTQSEIILLRSKIKNQERLQLLINNGYTDFRYGFKIYLKDNYTIKRCDLETKYSYGSEMMEIKGDLHKDDKIIYENFVFPSVEFSIVSKNKEDKWI